MNTFFGGDGTLVEICVPCLNKRLASIRFCLLREKTAFLVVVGLLVLFLKLLSSCVEFLLLI